VAAISMIFLFTTYKAFLSLFVDRKVSRTRRRVPRRTDSSRRHCHYSDFG